jgi:formylglycine-generating enzyme required for sulfatase activity
VKRLVAVALLLAACKRAPLTVEVPGATLMMGCDPARDPSCADTERPRHAVEVRGFHIDRTEVTVEAYGACIAARACTTPRDFRAELARRPVAHVTWAQALAYCRFRNARLPSEAEWELAARGTDGRIYPWGDGEPDCTLAHTHACGDAPADVATHPRGASPYGALDLAGNVDEWTADAFARYEGGRPSTERVARGGAWDAWHSRSTARNALAPDYHDALLGFRCASD